MYRTDQDVFKFQECNGRLIILVKLREKIQRILPRFCLLEILTIMLLRGSHTRGFVVPLFVSRPELEKIIQTVYIVC